MIDIWGFEYRRKSNKEIIKITGVSYPGTEDGSTVTFVDKTGKSIALSLPEFQNQFEVDNSLDFKQYKDQIVELCYQCPDFGRLGKIAAKRQDPDYFKVGDVVFVDPKYRSYIDSGDLDKCIMLFGPANPYIISSIIIPYSGINYGGVIRIVKKSKQHGKGEFDYEIPIYYTYPRVGDAYWVLCRYDKPY